MKAVAGAQQSSTANAGNSLTEVTRNITCVKTIVSSLLSLSQPLDQMWSSPKSKRSSCSIEVQLAIGKQTHLHVVWYTMIEMRVLRKGRMGFVVMVPCMYFCTRKQIASQVRAITCRRQVLCPGAAGHCSGHTKQGNHSHLAISVPLRP